MNSNYKFRLYGGGGIPSCVKLNFKRCRIWTRIIHSKKSFSEIPHKANVPAVKLLLVRVYNIKNVMLKFARNLWKVKPKIISIYINRCSFTKRRRSSINSKVILYLSGRIKYLFYGANIFWKIFKSWVIMRL